MELEEAERRISQVFPTEAGSKDTLSDEEALDLLDAMEAPIRSGWRGPRDSLATFLFYTCAKFDRWDTPSPVVVPPSYPDQFERALGLFRLVEDQRSEFVSLFELHGLQTKLYQDAAIVPGRAQTGHLDIEEYRRRLSEIPAPTIPQQRLEFTARRIRLERLLNGLEKANLKSALVLNLPYALHHRTVDAAFNWHGVHTEVSIQPFFSQQRLPGVAFEVLGAAVAPMYVSRWQAAMSTVRIQIDGLLDPSFYTPSLRERAGWQSPQEGWPSGHTFAFLLLYDLAWELRVHHQGEQQWIPAPADIGQVQYFLSDSVGNQLDMRAAAIGGIEARYGESGILPLSLEELSPLPWWERCKAQVALVLDLGDTPEALLWVNIAVEALFEERFNEFAVQLHRPELAQELTSPAALWIDAEKIVSKQFPDMAGKIKWPDTKRHISIFAKLRFIHRELDLACSLKETQRWYGIVSRHRNELFHGASSARPSAEHIMEALNALESLEKNFRLKEAGEGQQ
jgi:hypothetical protein